MKQINNELITQATNNLANSQPRAEINESDADLVNLLFKSLQAAFPAWRQAFKTDEDLRKVKATWVIAFAENGINSDEQLKRGMKMARSIDSDFFPNVGKFISWCNPTPEDFGLPQANESYLEACNNSHRVLSHRWSHNAVYEAGRRCGWHEIKCGSITEKQFKPIYEGVCQDVMDGKSILAPKVEYDALEKRGGNKTHTEKAKAARDLAMKELRGGL